MALESHCQGDSRAHKFVLLLCVFLGGKGGGW
jgi:hypothetical protein